MTIEKNDNKMNDDEYKIVEDSEENNERSATLTQKNIEELVADFENRATCVKNAILKGCADVEKEISVKFTGVKINNKLVGVSIGMNHPLNRIDIGIPLEILNNIDLAKSVCCSVIESVHMIDKGETP